MNNHHHCCDCGKMIDDSEGAIFVRREAKSGWRAVAQCASCWREERGTVSPVRVKEASDGPEPTYGPGYGTHSLDDEGNVVSGVEDFSRAETGITVDELAEFMGMKDEEASDEDL